MKKDLSNWYPKQEAAEKLGVSFKTLEKYVTAKKIQHARRPRPGLPDAAVYHPGDVDRLAAERQRQAAPGPFVVPKNGDHEEFANGSQTAVVPRDQFFDVLAKFAEASRTRPPLLSELLWLTLDQAAELSNLPRSYLREKIQSGELPAVKARGWRIRRRDLEAL